MSLLRESIRKHLLLEKIIGQVSSQIEVSFNLEIDRGFHSFMRKTRHDLEGKGYELTRKHSYEYNQKEITNAEIKDLINSARRQIAEKIVTKEIDTNKSFVVKSLNWELAVAIIPLFQGGTHWILKVTTVFRESLDNPFRTGKDQLVINVD